MNELILQLLFDQRWRETKPRQSFSTWIQLNKNNTYIQGPVMKNWRAENLQNDWLHVITWLSPHLSERDEDDPPAPTSLTAKTDTITVTSTFSQGALWCELLSLNPKKSFNTQVGISMDHINFQTTSRSWVWNIDVTSLIRQSIKRVTARLLVSRWVSWSQLLLCSSSPYGIIVLWFWTFSLTLMSSVNSA